MPSWQSTISAPTRCTAVKSISSRDWLAFVMLAAGLACNSAAAKDDRVPIDSALPTGSFWSVEVGLADPRPAGTLDAIVDTIGRSSGGVPEFPKTIGRRIVSITPRSGDDRRVLANTVLRLRAIQGVDWVRVRGGSEKALQSTSDDRPAIGLIVAPVAANGAIENGAFTPIALDQLRSLTAHDFNSSVPMAGGLIALRFATTLAASEADRIRGAVAASGFVEWADVDVLDQPHRVPNDTFYANQWNLSGSWGVNGPQAWDISTGSPSVIVAVIDTGILYSQPDLSPKLVGGYDLISDATNARDGNGPDANPSDEGNWNEVGDCGRTTFKSSNWHGSHVAGIIGAASNNGYGVTGVAWDVRILPVRVLGKCGGARSDIINGMYWAVGLSVPGVPANANPARILNMSLGSTTTVPTCSTAYQIAIDAVRNAGAIVVAAAGNNGYTSIGESGFYEPSGCPGVIVVGATDHLGYRALYSNWSTQFVVDLSAPGGDQEYYHDNAVGIYSTVDSGIRIPQGPAGAYKEGTSQAAPHVSGTLALMLSARPTLTNSQLYLSLIESTREFNPLSTCYRDSVCGWGIVNAHAALLRATSDPANAPTLTNLTSSANPVVVGQPFTLTASVTATGATGTVTFLYNGTPLNGCTNLAITAGAAGCLLTNWSVNAAGYHFQAVYNGDYTHHWSYSDELVQVVTPAGGLNYQGLWWNSGESGWGINLAHQSDQIYMTWYTYDVTGKSSWLAMLASKVSNNTYTGTMLEVHGSPYNATPYNPSARVVTPVGSGTLTFTSLTTGTFSFTAKNVSRSIPITKFSIGGPVPTCTYGAVPNFFNAVNYQDLWWGGTSQDGWGINLTHEGNTIYATWYTYDLDGSPLWLASLMSRASAGFYTGSLLRAYGPAFGPTFNPAQVTVATVGTASLAVANGGSA